LTIHEVFVDSNLHILRVLERNEDVFLVDVNEKMVRIEIKSSQGKMAMVEINGEPFQVSVERIQGNLLRVKIGGRIFEVRCKPKILKSPEVKLEPVAAIAKKPVVGLVMEKGAVVAPIAGRIIVVKTKVGQKIERGECICVLEAMKMQNEVAAVKAGVVKEVRVSEGAVVNKGDVLAVIA